MSRSPPGMDKHPPIPTQNGTKPCEQPQRWWVRQYEVATHGPATGAHLPVPG